MFGSCTVGAWRACSGPACRWKQRLYLVRRWCIPAFEGAFGTQYARDIRKKRCGSSCVDRIVAIVHSSIAALWSTMRSTSMLAYSASL